jgi:hypothetical protein
MVTSTAAAAGGRQLRPTDADRRNLPRERIGCPVSRGETKTRASRSIPDGQPVSERDDLQVQRGAWADLNWSEWSRATRTDDTNGAIEERP